LLPDTLDGLIQQGEHLSIRKRFDLLGEDRTGLQRKFRHRLRSKVVGTLIFQGLRRFCFLFVATK